MTNHPPPSMLPGHLRSHPVQLVGTCNALSQRSLVSKHITLPFYLNTISVRFPAGCDNQVRVYLFLSYDESSPTTELPPGTSILSFLSPNDYLLGDDVVVTIHPRLPVPERSTWIKAHIVNDDSFPHTISAQLYITELHTPEAT